MADAASIKFDRYLAILLVLGIIYTGLVAALISQFKALPSPLFGGDYYHQLGYIYSMYERPAWDWLWASPMEGQLPAYFPLYGSIVTAFGKLAGLDPIQAMLKANYIFPLAALLLFYMLIKELLGSSELALIGSAAMVSYANFPILKYTEFTSIIMVPLFLYALLLFFKDQRARNAAFLGLSYGAMSISHSTSFMYASVMVVAVFAWLLYERKDSLASAGKALAPMFALSFGVGFLIAQAMWFTPIVVYHGSPPLKNHLWTLPDVARLDVAFKVLFDGLASMFFNTSSMLTLLLSLLSLGGLWLLASGWRTRAEPDFRFLLFAFAATFIFVYSYFVTSPLLDTHFIPTYSQPMYLSKIAVLIGLFFAKEKILPEKGYRQMFIAVFVLVFVLARAGELQGWQSNQWTDSARAGIDPLFGSLQAYLLANTSVNDVVLTNNEMSFAVFSLSGREVVVSRRSQNDPFMDFDRRELDAAKILYGDNTSEKLNLLRKYKVKYIYYDLNWPSLEYSADQQGRITNYFDPLMVVSSPGNSAELDSEGIKHIDIYSYIDPAIRGPDIRRYNISLVSPENYDFGGKGIWKDDIDPYLSPVWSAAGSDGKPVAVLYRVDLP